MKRRVTKAKGFKLLKSKVDPELQNGIDPRPDTSKGHLA